MQVKVKKNAKKHNEFKVEMVLTEGAILALTRALTLAQANPIADDLSGFVAQAAKDAGIDVPQYK